MVPSREFSVSATCLKDFSVSLASVDQTLRVLGAEQRIDLGEDAVDAHGGLVQAIGKLVRIGHDLVDVVGTLAEFRRDLGDVLDDLLAFFDADSMFSIVSRSVSGSTPLRISSTLAERLRGRRRRIR